MINNSSKIPLVSISFTTPPIHEAQWGIIIIADAIRFASCNMHDKTFSFSTWKMKLTSFPQEISSSSKKRDKITSVQPEEQIQNIVELRRISFQSSLTNVVLSVSLVAAAACRSLPRPPGGAAHWTLVFAAAGLDCGAQRREVSLSQLLLTGRLQLVEVVQQSSLGLCLHLLLTQEVGHLLDTSGVALSNSCWVHSLTILLLQSSQHTNGHLQDVGFLQLGVWLLFEELWIQERLELLNAAVDSLSA